MKSNLLLVFSAIILILLIFNDILSVKVNSSNNNNNINNIKIRNNKLFKYRSSFLKKSIEISLKNVKDKNPIKFEVNKKKNELNNINYNDFGHKLISLNYNDSSEENHYKKKLSDLKVNFNSINNTSLNFKDIINKEKNIHNKQEEEKLKEKKHQKNNFIINNTSLIKNITISNLLINNNTINNKEKNDNNNYNYDKNKTNNINKNTNLNKNINNYTNKINENLNIDINKNNNTLLNLTNLSINPTPIKKLKLISTSKIEDLKINTNLNTNLNTNIESNSEKEENTNFIKENNFDQNINTGFFRYIFIQKISLTISIYLQLFLIFFSLSFLKFYEEYFKVKKIFCDNKYSLFTNLTPENKDQILCSTDNLIFSSGKPDIILPAKDEFFDFIQLKKFVKIERIVEIYDINEKNWKILGKKNFSFLKKLNNEKTRPDFFEDFEGNCYSENNNDINKYDNKFDSNNSNSKIIEISFNDKIFTFPKIFSEINIGKVY
jgi:hypothetical protein